MKIISGQLKNRKIVTPQGLATRPTSSQLREAVFNICQSYIDGARFLDLFAGSGAMGLEALSRGASNATFIENNRACIHCIRQSLKAFELETRGKVLVGDVPRHLQSLLKGNEVFDIIYADPPYGEGVSVKGRFVPYGSLVLKIADEGNFMSDGSVLFIEEANEVKVHEESLQTLKLKSCRRFGRSTLYQYVNWKNINCGRMQNTMEQH